MFFPVRRRTYNAGNYVYAFFAKEWKHGTRIGLGGYDFTRQVVSRTPIVGRLQERLVGRQGLSQVTSASFTRVGKGLPDSQPRISRCLCA
jgi:hypothetical protein